MLLNSSVLGSYHNRHLTPPVISPIPSPHYTITHTITSSHHHLHHLTPPSPTPSLHPIITHTSPHPSSPTPSYHTTFTSHPISHTITSPAYNTLTHSCSESPQSSSSTPVAPIPPPPTWPGDSSYSVTKVWCRSQPYFSPSVPAR